MLETHAENYKKLLIITEKGKDTLRIKYENEIYDQNLVILEEQDLQKQNEIFLSEKKTRQIKYMWDKTWKNLRSHYGTWMHPDFYTQNDKPFDPADFEYDKIKQNNFFYYKIWKYEIKNRSRPFLKIKVKDPDIIVKNEEELKNKKHSLLSNYQAILHLSPLKTMTQTQDNKIMSQQTMVQNEENLFSNSNSGLITMNSTRNKSKFISDVKKNISNSIKVFLKKYLIIIKK